MSKKIAILTGGGDCPGLNAVIRAVAKKAMTKQQWEVIGIEDGYDGLIHNRHRILKYEDVSSILTLGGTILGTSNIANPYRYPVKKGKKITFEDVSEQVVKNIKKLEIDCLVCIGGDGTLNIAHRLSQAGISIVGVPKTIDNDIMGTDVTFGFHSAVTVATHGIDSLHTTAQSHHRVMIIEVMGRRAGWIALYAGVAGGGDIILIPEIPYDIDVIVAKVKARNKKGKRFSIVVVAEGAKTKSGSVVASANVKDGTDPIRFGGVGFALAKELEKITGLEARAVVMGHLLRGGSPTPYDRVLGTQLGAKAVDLIENSEFGYMVGVKGDSLIKVPLDIVAQGSRLVPANHSLIQDARSVGTCFGD